VSLDDIQGNVICGYANDHAHYVFARVIDPAAVRGWLGEALGRITFNSSWGAHRPEHTLNVAFTHAGLLALGVPDERLHGLGAFRAGMAARAELIGDAAESAPDTWPQELRGNHLLLTLTAWTPHALDGARAELTERLSDPASGLSISHMQPAKTLPQGREHFGFSDGFSQPSIAGASTGPRAGEGTLRLLWGWRAIALGEFILGHRDEGGLAAPAPEGPLGRDSTFMVVRKLEQDVARFRAYTAEQARIHDRDPAWIAAKMVGRWQNGSSLVDYPDGPGPDASDPEARERINRFKYGDDPHGHACPLGAHVRRAQPRDALGWQGRLTQRHRLLRRGMSYGAPLEPKRTDPDGDERGLMFVCFGASLERQFEFVQRQWLGDGNVFGLGADRDPLAAGAIDQVGSSEPRGMVIQGRRPLFLAPLPRFVTTRGGDYFLLPGREGLEALAAGRT
jgi:Dyp-type peroxidase family